jgi:hypothetical protein
MEEKVSPQRRHFTSGNMGITGSSVLFQLQEDMILPVDNTSKFPFRQDMSCSGAAFLQEFWDIFPTLTAFSGAEATFAATNAQKPTTSPPSQAA